MSNFRLQDISAKMKSIDIAMMSTHTSGDEIAARPMSNNRDVDYDGTSHYFALEDTRTVRDITKNSNVGLTFQTTGHFYIALEGDAQLIREKSSFEDHWNSDLDEWFKDGIDTEGLVLIKVEATRIHYWDGMDEGEIKL